jgi:predicted acyltransferase
METENNPPVTTIYKRADALDALRGIAVLLMVLSGTIAYRILPSWMYHAQVPPPTHKFNPNLPGLTWVDLVFPLFLFAMGAAIPLALSRRIEKGWTIKQVILSILKRGFLLGAFAIFLQHIRPNVINPKLDEPSLQEWWLALEGFVILFFMFVRLPESLSSWSRKVITLAAWTIGIIFVSHIQYPQGTGFSLERSDIILIVLTNMAVFGSIIWLFTRSNLWLRVGLLGIIFTLRLSSGEEGWVKILWDSSPIPWLFQFDYLKYLFIVIPGTIVGDLIYQWSQSYSEDESPSSIWKKRRYLSITILMLTIILLLLIGLQSRWLWSTTLLGFILCFSGLYLFKQPFNATEKMLTNLYNWGIYWLILGLIFEPYQGGIKKDSATLSYFFVTTGIAIFFLIALTILIEIFQLKKWLQIFIDNGMNPMIGYVGFANFLWPILVLNNWETTIIEMTSSPIRGFFRGVFYTTIIALVVTIFTRLKLFLRT